MGRAFFYLPVPIAAASASSSAPGFDPANVANDLMGMIYKSAGGSDAVEILIDCGTPTVVDTAVMFGCTGAQASWTLSVKSSSTVDFSSDVTIHATGLAFLAGQAMPTHGRGVSLWTASNPPAAKRYWLFNIGNLGNAQVGIARIALGQRIQLARNFTFGGAFGVRDLGSVNFSTSGVRLLREAAKLRTIGLTFPAVTKEEAEAKVQPLVEQAAGQLPIVLVTDPELHPLRQRRCWFGHLTGELGTIWRSAQGWEWRASLIDLVAIPAGAGSALDVTPPVITSPATFAVDENAALLQAAAASTPVTWSKGGIDAGLITLNTATGAWSLPAQDYEARQSVSFVLIATKQSNGLSSAQPVTVTINDLADGGGTPTSPPVFSVAPVISGTPTEGQTLSATTGTASNSPTYVLQWKRNGAAISGATASTYVLVTADVGTVITVTSTATNAGGSVSSTSVATATIAASTVVAPTFPTTVNTSLSVFSITPESTTNPTAFTLGDMGGTAANDVMWIEAATSDEYTANLTRHYHTITDAELAAGPPYNFTFTPALSALSGSTRRYRPTLQRGTERSAYGTSRTVGPNDVAPVLSALSVSGVGSGAATINFTTNYPAGTAYVVLTTTNVAPSTAAIIAGLSQVITSAGAKTQAVTGTSGTTRYAWVMHRPDAGPDSVITSAGQIDFVAGSTAKLATADGVNKNNNLTVTGSGLIATVNTSQGAALLVRSTDTPPDQLHYEMTCTFNGTNSTGLYIGISDAAQTLAGTSRPGNGSILGFILEFYPTNATAYLLKDGGFIEITMPVTPANSDILACEYNKTTKAVLLKLRRGATVSNVWSGTLTNNFPTNPTATVGGRWINDSVTVNFGASTFAITPTSGYAGW